MSLGITRDITFNVSLDNIKAAVETSCLRAMTKYVRDHEEVVEMEFGDPVKGEALDGSPTVVIPIRCKIEGEQEVSAQ